MGGMSVVILCSKYLFDDFSSSPEITAAGCIMAPIKVILLGDCKLLPFSISQWNQRVKQIITRIIFDEAEQHETKTHKTTSNTWFRLALEADGLLVLYPARYQKTDCAVRRKRRATSR